MGCSMSRLTKATISLVILALLFMPGAMVRRPDGGVLKWNGNKIGWTNYAHGPDYSSEACTASKLRPETVTESHCSRPLDLQFHHKTGNLYIADAYKGLMRVGPAGGEAAVLVNQVDGAPLPFTNGVDIDQITGQVYFTDSSMNYQRSQHEMSGITYPNGVSISHDRTHLVVEFTGPCKLLRYWIKGPNSGKTEPFADLPGYPDNVRQDRRGGYWMALHHEKNELPFEFGSHLLAVRVGPNGKIVEEMRGPKSVRPTKIIERSNGKYYMGSVELPYVGIVT
ncbi:hypothetical protein BRADI_4g14156v3 [Brachypodium distachyon]|uniref:Uncharacterized protein n=1 Tax=Brachypodium distachyon TaxID=15368 RepID=A0A0Q3H3A7_BRADI|nr:hypothetical protein BRADI_4g14156v3 [Brachypodium distachyon]